MPGDLMVQLWDYIFSGAVILGAIVLGLLFQFFLLLVIRAVARRTKSGAEEVLQRNLRWPFRLLFPLIFCAIALPFLKMPPDSLPVAERVIATLLIVTAAWILIKIIASTMEFIELRFDKTRQGNLRARKIFTQMQIIRRIVSVIIILIAVAVILLQFEQISNIGTTILASAGVIGVIIGFAAQRSISTIFAGFQIAFSQPIRIDDVVVVENEWGVIEEITLTYVVVRVWDLHRLILPITYFIEKPFQNLTRKSSELLGTVSLHVDYSIPVETVRQKLCELVASNPDWDKETCALDVVESGDKTMELRALVSASDSGRLWRLRCRVREDLIGFIQKEFPHGLPKIRSSVEGK